MKWEVRNKCYRAAPSIIWNKAAGIRGKRLFKNEPSITIMTNIPRVVSNSIKNSFVIILLLLFVPMYFTII